MPELLCPPEVRRLIDTFVAAGENAYLVGGCVRDALMGRTPHDWDIAVTTLPEQTQTLCRNAGYRTIPTGIAHGTITVLLPILDTHSTATPANQYRPVECTTCRTEGGYSDGRHPDSVTFTGRIRDDLSRRDFTVNAMAATLDPSGRFAVIDLFGGQEDLARGILRCVGDATARLTEDALRILRAVRFAAKLGLAPDDALTAAIPAVAPGLARISRERICAEFAQILCGPDPACGLRLLHDWGLWPYVLPFGETIGAHDAYATDGSGDKMTALPADLALRMACLLWAQPADMAVQNLHSLRLPGDTIRRVMACLSDRDAVPRLPDPTPENARRLRHRLGDMALPSLAVRAACRQDTSVMAHLVEESVARGDCVTLADLAIGGRELAALGIPTGKETGRILKALLDAVMTDPEKNTREELINEAKKRQS